MSLSESDTRAKLIDPAIHAAGWTEDLIRREETAGAIEVVDGRPRRRSRGRVDYVLRVRVNPNTQPVAVAIIEAKAESLPPTHGLEQAKVYARCKRLNVPFVYSSNGHQFVEYNRNTGKTSFPKPMSAFPPPSVLRMQYEKIVGFSLEDPEAKPLLVPYTGGEATRRYYQDAAIRAILERIALQEKTNKPKRALLSLATGAGKTFIAVNLLKRIADAGRLRRALFICDRDELRSQGLGAFQNVFGADAAEVYKKPDGTNNAKNARIHIATYQTLDVDTAEGTANFLTTFYPENYFSHIVIDECHRSAWGKWSEVLKRNPDAVQVGLTATPRELKIDEYAPSPESKQDLQITADNIRHFGDPVYEYDLTQGIEDGYLAACEVQRGRVDIDDTGITLKDILARNPRDFRTGQPISEAELKALYEKTEYEDRIMLPDRVFAMCRDLFKYLLDTGGPEQKTIIFCVRDIHADLVATEMNNLYADWCTKNSKERYENYAFKCTAAVSGSQYLADLRGASRSHFIATTVELLTTGVDVPVVRNIVFFKYVRSPIAFYQMIGRGSRIDTATNKLMFRIYDYTNATRLFGKDFKTPPPRVREGGGPGPEPPKIIVVEGFDIQVTDAGRAILTAVDGREKLVTIEEYKEILTKKLIEEAANLDQFRKIWIVPPERLTMLGRLPDAGRSPLLVQKLEDMEEYDLYDVLADLGYGLRPMKRPDRAYAFTYKNARWLGAMPENTSKTVTAIAHQFALAGTDGLENREIFHIPDVVRAGGIAALKLYGEPATVLRETKERMFAA